MHKTASMAIVAWTKLLDQSLLASSIMSLLSFALLNQEVVFHIHCL